MKKFFSTLSLVAILGLTTPVFAGPGGPGGHGGPPAGGKHGGGHQAIHAGPGMHGHRPHPGGHFGAHSPAPGFVATHTRPMHLPPPPHPRHHGYYSNGGLVVGGVLARRSYWRSPYYDYRLGFYDNYYYSPSPYYGSGVYLNFGIPIRF